MRLLFALMFCSLVALPLAAQNALASSEVSEDTCTSNTGVFARSDNGVYDVFRFENGDLINITNDSANDYAAALSPDHNHIAFISDRGGTAVELYLMSPSGENIRQLTDDGVTKGYFAWSLDSQHIAYTAFYDMKWEEVLSSPNPVSGQRADVFVIDVESLEVVQMTEGMTAIETLAWNNAMTEIAFIGEKDGVRGIYTVTIEGGEAQLIAELDTSVTSNLLQWSPDAQYIAYNTFGEGSAPGIEVVDINNGAVTQLGEGSPDTILLLAFWTADSSSIVRTLIDGGTTYELVDIVSGEVTPLSELTVRALCYENVRSANEMLTETSP
jgi:Tol biopolymer transport system component